jgi:hypothetical protein
VGHRGGLDGCGEENISCHHRGKNPEPSCSESLYRPGPFFNLNYIQLKDYLRDL